MVFVQFPSQCSEEEGMLSAKYLKLRKKKKALNTLKAPKSEPEPPPVVTRKRPLEGKDAKEIAKKLLSSGKITAIQKPSEKTTFKRSLGLERKLSGVEHRIARSSSLSAPYATPRPNNAPPLPPLDARSSPSGPMPPRPSGRNRNRKKGFDGPRRSGPPIPLDMDAAIDGPSAAASPTKGKSDSLGGNPAANRRNEREKRSGNTIYVYGFGITEDILRRAFINFGVILRVSTDTEKNCGFVTFARPEMAEAAINAMNGSMFGDVTLKVSLARRQPLIDPEALAAASGEKGVIGGTESLMVGHRGPGHHEERELVAYEDDIF